MTASEANLASALRERLRIISDEESRRHAEDHMCRLQKISEQIEMLIERLPPPIAPRLVHFLERRSYEKALQLLEGRDD